MKDRRILYLMPGNSPMQVYGSIGLIAFYGLLARTQSLFQNLLIGIGRRFPILSSNVDIARGKRYTMQRSGSIIWFFVYKNFGEGGERCD